MPTSTTTAYRAYIYLGNVRYYANRLEETITTWRVSWHTFAEEYPDVFSWEEYQALRLKYLDQAVKYEVVYVQREAEEA